MNDDYKRGLITGLAMQPLYVTTNSGGYTDMVKFGTHNLLTDSGITFGTDYTEFSVVGEKCVCRAKACDVNLRAWYRSIGNITFKKNYMYKLVASIFDGYGRFGVTYRPGANPSIYCGQNAYGIFPLTPGYPSDGDNHVLQNGWLKSQFYLGQVSPGPGVTAMTGELWWCTDYLYNEQKSAHSFEIALYEEIKS